MSESKETRSGELVELTPKTPAKSEAKEPVERTTTRCAYICARWARLGCSRARTRLPSPKRYDICHGRHWGEGQRTRRWLVCR